MLRMLGSVPDVLLPDCGDVVQRDASPTARALLALELVQGSPGITADRLARKLGVSERAARRYVGILREAGIPIVSVRGPYGGYRVGRGLRIPPPTAPPPGPTPTPPPPSCRPARTIGGYCSAIAPRPGHSGSAAST